MYNSKFAVAAERCTKGIFLQFLELDEELRKKLGVQAKYMLNLDTEGLRAPELQSDKAKSLKHDNEMATLIIGMAD